MKSVIPQFSETYRILNKKISYPDQIFQCAGSLVRVLRLFLCWTVVVFAGTSLSQEVVDSAFSHPSCFVQTLIYGPSDADRELVLFNGVPVTGLIFEALARELTQSRSDLRIIAADLPGTGGSRLTDTSYSWSTQRTCVDLFLSGRRGYYLMVHDAAGPVILPLLPKLEGLEGIIILNTVLKPTVLEPPFPLNFMHSSRLAGPLARLTPFFYYNSRMRSLGIVRNEHISDEFMRSLFEDTKRNNGMARLTDVMRGFELSQRSDSLIARGLSDPRPQLVIWADEDPVLGDQLLYLEPGHPNRIVHHLPEAKHFFMLDHAEETAGRILEWLDRWDRH